MYDNKITKTVRGKNFYLTILKQLMRFKPDFHGENKKSEEKEKFHIDLMKY